MDWTSYLPPTLQISTVYWVIGYCFAVRMMCATIPDKYRTPWLTQLIVLLVGIPAAVMLFPGTVAKVYAVGTGMMGAALCVQFYDIAFTVLEKKVRAWIGVTSGPAEPLEYLPSSPSASSTPNSTPTQK